MTEELQSYKERLNDVMDENKRIYQECKLLKDNLQKEYQKTGKLIREKNTLLKFINETENFVIHGEMFYTSDADKIYKIKNDIRTFLKEWKTETKQ